MTISRLIMLQHQGKIGMDSKFKFELTAIPLIKDKT
jgi:hypothetical protein